MMRQIVIRGMLFAALLGGSGCGKPSKLAPGVALPKLQAMLKQAGADAGLPDPAQTWQVFKQFAAVPVECAEDGLLFECGVYKFTVTACLVRPGVITASPWCPRVWQGTRALKLG